MFCSRAPLTSPRSGARFFPTSILGLGGWLNSSHGDAPLIPRADRLGRGKLIPPDAQAKEVTDVADLIRRVALALERTRSKL